VPHPVGVAIVPGLHFDGTMGSSSDTGSGGSNVSSSNTVAGGANVSSSDTGSVGKVVTVTEDWNGRPLTLQPYGQAAMANTPNGSMIFAWRNKAGKNNDGSLMLGSGAAPTKSLPAPAGLDAPSIFVNNWQANNLTVTNFSPNPDTPIEIQAYGPGMPGQDEGPLEPGKPTKVHLNQMLVASLTGGSRQLVFTRADGYVGLFGLIGGPLVYKNNPPADDDPGNNAYVFAVNFPKDENPAGYTGTTPGNRYVHTIKDWNSKIYVFYFDAARLLAQRPGDATVFLAPS